MKLLSFGLERKNFIFLKRATPPIITEPVEGEIPNLITFTRNSR